MLSWLCNPVRRWMERLTNAQRNESLPVLAARMSRAIPEDSTLQSVCRLLSGQSDMEAFTAGLLLAAGAAATLIALLMTGTFLAGVELVRVVGPPLQAIALQPQSLLGI